MTAVLITNSLLSKLKPENKAYDVRDNRLKGFIVRVQPSGSMSYVVQYARGKRATLGKVGVLTPVQAREKAIKILGDYANGLAPNQSREKQIESAAMKKIVSTEQ